MILTALGLILLCSIAAPAPPLSNEDWIRKEVSAVILMTLEFVKDMDMKMRDVRRVERYYYGTMDFGAGRIFTNIGHKFDHMCALYANTSRMEYILDQNLDLRSQVVGMLQFMLSDYNELLSLIDLFKERYSFWKASSMRWNIRDTIEKFLVSRGVYPKGWEKRFIFNAMFATVRPQGSKSKAKTTNATTPSTTTQNRIVSVFNDLRKQKTTKDADLVIKMTADFITDMQQKMYQIKRIERSYSDSADFITGTVYDDIQRRFKHMCDLYKQFATVDRYIFGNNLNNTAPGIDVVVVFQIMLSDYNEIMMMMELFKIEQLAWKQGIDDLKSRDLIQKQMEKFGNLPSDVSPPILTWLPRVASQSFGWQEFWSHDLNAIDDDKQMFRLADLMRGYVERHDQRLKELMPLKTEIDIKSITTRKAFEKGYIMGDIVEAYRKAVVFTQKQMVKKRYLESARLRYMTYVQNAYIKIYHLAHMMHEIDPKFSSDNTGQFMQFNANAMFHKDTPTHWNTSGFYYTKELDDIRQERVRERQNKIVKEKEMRLHEMNMHGTLKPGSIKTTTNWWPKAYGWDIDYYW